MSEIHTRCSNNLQSNGWLVSQASSKLLDSTSPRFLRGRCHCFEAQEAAGGHTSSAQWSVFLTLSKYFVQTWYQFRYFDRN